MDKTYSEFDDGMPPPPPAAAARVRRKGIRVWDLPTRLFHWALLATVSGAVVCAQLGGNWMEWHVRFGLATLGLLAFRAVWGVVGPRYARFASFLYPPRAVLAHFKPVRRSSERHAGHSPSGALSVFTLLGVLGLMTLSGLFSSDSISTEGPLVRFASEAGVSVATFVHVKLQWVIYALAGLHIVTVLGYLVVKKTDLIRPMLNGNKRGIRAPDAADSIIVRLIGLTLMVVSLVGVFSLLGG